jgi:hypothetical protein
MSESEKNEVDEGFNAREEMAGALERLASISHHELIQPITVRPFEGGELVAVAGHRRLAAVIWPGRRRRRSTSTSTATLAQRPSWTPDDDRNEWYAA